VSDNLTIRLDEETKALFNSLAEQSELENKGVFLNRLITLYQSEQLKEQAPLLKPAIEAVETLTARLLDVLNGAGATIITKEDEQKRQLDDHKKSFDETRALLQQRITYFEQSQAESEQRMQEFIEDKKEAEQQIQGLHTRIQDLEQTAQDKQALVSEYKSKNDTLTSIIDEYKTAADENKMLKSENVNLTQQIQDTERQLLVLNQEIDRQAKQYIADMDHQKDILSLEREKAVLEADRRHQDELQELREKHSQKIEEYETKILNLIDEKAASTVSPPPKKTDGRRSTSAAKKDGRNPASEPIQEKVEDV